MAGFLQNQPLILISIALILTSPISNVKSEDEPDDYSGTFLVATIHDSEKTRMASYFPSEKSSDHSWIKLGNRKKNELPPDDTIYSEEVSLHNISLAFPLNISGYKIRNVRLSSVGSISSMDDMHQWFVSPVQGTYGTSSTIKYINGAGGHFRVQWEIVPFFKYAGLEDKKLLMQVQVFPNGDVKFFYKKIPFGSMRNFRKNLKYAEEEGGFIFIDILPDGRSAILAIPISFDKRDVKEGEIIHFKSLPFCPNFRTCKRCSEAKIEMEDTGETIPCVWCPEIKRCSSKKDYFQQYWLSKKCEHQEISDPLRCPKGSADEEGETSTSVKILTLFIYSLFISFLLYKLMSRRGLRRRVR